MEPFAHQIAAELSVATQQVAATIKLLEEGATVPFIARYRKEVTGGLDDTQLRHLAERLSYLKDLEDRRQTILNSIREQDKLTPELEQSILSADTKTRLEDLYLPYKPKRRTKGQIAIEAGIEPLADALFNDPQLDPHEQAAGYFNEEQGFADGKAVLDGAKFILMERFSEDAGLLGKLRHYLAEQGLLIASVIPGKETEGAKFRDYFDHREAIGKVPSHRALAMFRGRKEGFLSLKVDLDIEAGQPHPCEGMVAAHFNIEQQNRPADSWLQEVVKWTWRVKLQTHLETDLLGELRQKADEEAIRVFAANLKDLLLAAPAGSKTTLGLDPGLRTGVKLAVIDSTGKVVDHGAIFPNAPQHKTVEAEAVLVQLCQKHQVALIAIGNGTASRETDRFVADVLKRHPELQATSVIVNEAGASVYSASEYAARELPDYDVTIRGAISIARRLQDPLAELVKIESKSIGVGQYQHDVSQTALAGSLDAVVEDCVNAVGVDVNTASSALLKRVSGISTTLADNIIDFRNHHGVFKNRQQLKKVTRFGDKTFELAAGFMRIASGDNPLDNSAVHPESYHVVEAMAAKNQQSVAALIGNRQLLRALKAGDYVTETVGLPTVTDIIEELEKPGRDPRPEFKVATFKEGVETLKDLQPEMTLEGTVTNVTNFGAFVDIGVHQDGLVHISALADRFVKDPREIVKAGDIVKVKVLEVDIPRKRIALTMRLSDTAPENAKQTKTQQKPRHKEQRQKAQRQERPQKTGSFAKLLMEAGIKK